MKKLLITTILAITCSSAYANFAGVRTVNGGGLRLHETVLSNAMEVIPSLQDLTDQRLRTEVMQKCGFRAPDEAVVENIEITISEFYKVKASRSVKLYRGKISYNVKCSNRHP